VFLGSLAPHRESYVGHSNTVIPPKHRRFLALLFGRLQNAGEHRLGASSSGYAVAAPVLARADERSDGSLAYVVSGLQPGRIEESEHRYGFVRT